MNKLLHTLAEAGATILAKKLQVVVPETMVMGQLMTYKGRRPDRTKVVKIENWPECKTVTDVRVFLGTAGTVRTWVKDFASIAHPLVELTKKGVEFGWGEREQKAMNELKERTVKAPCIRPIDYQSGCEVVLAVDSSHIAVGWILSQYNEDGH